MTKLAQQNQQYSQSDEKIDSLIQKFDMLNIGKWTNQENIKYAIFMDFHKVTLSSRQKKKKFRVYQQMARFIGTRNIVQCRSHHQKLEERFRHFKKIIIAIKNQIGRKQYKQYFNKWTRQGKELIYNQSKPQQIVQIQKQELKQEEALSQKQEQIASNKNQQMIFTPTMFPLFTYQPFQNAFFFALPDIYQIGAQFY